MKKYDVVTIGSSPKVFIELLKYAKDGKECLIIGTSNWKNIKLGDISDIEDGCFFIDYKEDDYELLVNSLNITLESGEFEPFFLYKNRLCPISSNFLKGKYNATKLYKYPKNGLKSIIDTIKKYIKDYSIDILDINVNSIFIDFTLKKIQINNTIISNKILTGYNLNVSKISSNKSDFFIERTISNIFTYLIIHVKLSRIDFSFIDFSFCEKNILPNEINNELIFYQKNDNKFLWRIKDITSYSTLKDSNERILCIDTKGWLPKKDIENQANLLIFNFLKDMNLIGEFYIKNFSWNIKKAYTIENIADDINKIYFPYLKVINPLFFQKEDDES